MPGTAEAARPRSLCCCAALVLSLIGGPVLAAARAERPRYQVAVVIDTDQRHLSGRARITWTNSSSAPLERVLLWLYPERFAVRPAALNDFNLYWVYPYRFNPASMRILAARQVDRARPAALPVTLIDHPQAGPATLLQLPLLHPLEPGGRVTLEIDYEVHLPKRYGAFGCRGATCTLGGGFYPMLPPLGPQGFDLKAPPALADYEVEVSAPRPSDVIVQGELSHVGRGGTRRAQITGAQAVTLMVSRPAFRTEVLVHRGVQVLYHLTSPRPVRTPPGFVVPYWPADRQGRVLAAAQKAIDLLAELGLPMPPGEVLHLFEGPLRTEVAQALPGAVLVSDRLFDVFPLGPFLAAHERALVRAIYDEYIARSVGRSERPADQGWAPDVAASFLVDRYALRAAQKSPRETVAKVGFLPTADQILYAPQVPFSTTYFSSLADPDPLRDSLTQFNNDWPRGLTIYAKLLDLMGAAAVERIVRAQLGGTPLREAAEAVHGGPLGWFFAQWVGPYPQVDYRLRDVRVTRTGQSCRVSLVVEKIGDRPPVEPVEVRVRDRKGRSRSEIWDGRGRQHRYDFALDAPVADIQLDPRGRLQQDLPDVNQDLKFGERLPPRWKLLLGNLNLAAGASTIDLDVGLALWRVRDLKNTLRFAVLHNELNTIGLAAFYTRWFGAKVTPALLAWNVSGGVTAARVPALGTTGIDSLSGSAVTATVSLGWDDRLYLWEPVRGHVLNLTGSYTLTVLDNAAVSSRGTLSATGETIMPLADGHRLVFELSGGITFGDIATSQQLVSAGGPSGLRGFTVDQLLGRASLFGRAEYRHVLTHALDFNIMSTYYIRAVTGSLFAESGFTSACQSYAVTPAGLATDVGYNLNFFAEWFGITPNIIGFSLIAPLVRPAQSCLGAALPAAGRSPVVFLLNFGQPW